MTARTQPPAPYAMGSAGYDVETVTYYHGRAKIWSPSPRWPGASAEEWVTCDHRHTDPRQAETCGQRLGARTVKARNAAAIPELARTPCEIGASLFDKTEGLWIKYCAGHHTSATALQHSEADALALAWTCPWTAEAAEAAEEMTVWCAPSGRLHSFRRCSGAGPEARVKMIRVTREQFTAAVRCPCLPEFRGT
jgi:hypothetical protein